MAGIPNHSMKRESQIPTRNQALCRVAGRLVPVLTLLSALVARAEPEPAKLPEPSSRPSREVVEDAFAARAVKSRTDRAANALSATLELTAQEARFVRLMIRRPHGGQPCVDEIEIFGPDSSVNLALASGGAVASASSALPGYAIHAVPHLNDGRYGNDHSWIAATGEPGEWAQIELPAPASVARVVFSRDRNGQFTDRQILEVEVCVSSDGQAWKTAGTLKRTASEVSPPRPTLTFPVGELTEPTWKGAVAYAFLRERDTWSRMDGKD